jgi:hypothetical protein
VVRRFMTLAITVSANSSQSSQRVTEWRNSLGSNGLAVVGDFLDSMDLRSSEAYQDVANHLLDNERYAYYKTKDKIKNGEVTVRKTSLYTCTPLNYK